MPTHEWFEARRREKLQAHQSALPPEERMINRTDWDDIIIHRVAVTTARSQVDAKRKFVTLAVDPNVGICETRDQALAYFSSGGPPLTTAVLRKFAEALAISSRPVLKKDALSACSCAHTLLSLWAASKAAGKPVPRDVKEDTLSYVYGPLVTKGLIHTVQEITDAAPCPAAGVSTSERLPRCAETAHLDAAGMRKHLEEVHDIRHVKPKSQSKGLKRTQESLDGVEEDGKNGTEKRSKTG